MKQEPRSNSTGRSSKGGKARAKVLSPEQRSYVAMLGGSVTFLRHGPEHYSKIRKAAWAKMSEADKEKVRARLRKFNAQRKKKRQQSP
jgi:hypothetical protein